MAVIGNTCGSNRPAGSARPGWLAGRARLSGGLLACALAQPAAANLLVEHQVIEAWIALAEPGAPGNGSQGVAWEWGQPPGSVTVVSSERGSTWAAAARQTPDGTFHTIANQGRTWTELACPRVALAQTLFQRTLSTNTPDTPLVLAGLVGGGLLWRGRRSRPPGGAGSSTPWRRGQLGRGGTSRPLRRAHACGRPGHRGLLLVLGVAASLAAPLARADATAAVGGVVGNSPGLAFIGFESDDVVGSGVARVSDSQQVQPLGGGVLNWIVGAYGDTRRGSAGAQIVADRSQTGPRGRIQAAGMVSDTLHFTGSRAGEVVFSAGVFGSFEALAGSRFLADGVLTAITLGDTASADVRFEWSRQNGSVDPSVVATPGTTGISNLPANLSATLHLPLLVQPGQDVVLSLNLSAIVDVAANDHAEVNFGHTAQLAISLPEGLSYTSASGDFMVDAPPLPSSPVPEPASWALLLAGLGGLALRVRRAAQHLRHSAPLRLVLALGLAGAGGSAWADASAQVRSDSFESGLFERIDGGQPVVARAALSGGGALNTGPGQGSFLATAEADLRRGTLRASAMVNTVGDGLTVAGSSSSLSDALFFSNSEPITVSLQLAVHGAFNGLLRAYGDVYSQLRLGANLIRTELRWDTGPQELPSTPVRLLPVAGGTSPSRQVDLRSNLAANTLLVITASTEVMPGQPIVVDAAMSLSAWASSNAISQVGFGNTAQLTLQVPDGVVVRSASGLFLSQPPLPVPEPASAALMAAGLLMLAPCWYRRVWQVQPRHRSAGGLLHLLLHLPRMLRMVQGMWAEGPERQNPAHAVRPGAACRRPIPAGRPDGQAVRSGAAGLAPAAFCRQA